MSYLSRNDIDGMIRRKADFTGTIMSDDAAIEHVDSFEGCAGVIDAGQDGRGYRFIGVRQHDESWMVKAGCRWFTIEESLLHWGRKDNQDALRRVQKIIDGASNYAAIDPMTVGRLMALLAALDPERPVVVHDGDEGIDYPVLGVRIERGRTIISH
jgi:hypothetical protein